MMKKLLMGLLLLGSLSSFGAEYSCFLFKAIGEDEMTVGSFKLSPETYFQGAASSANMSFKVEPETKFLKDGFVVSVSKDKEIIFQTNMRTPVFGDRIDPYIIYWADGATYTLMCDELLI